MTVISNLIAATKRADLTILDYGCGSGAVLECIPHEKVANYWGIDVSADAIEKAKEKYQNPKFRFLQGDTLRLPENSKKKFDVILIIGVLQYLSNQEINDLFSACDDLLEEDGKIIMSCLHDTIWTNMSDVYRLFSPHRPLRQESLQLLLNGTSLQVTQSFSKGVFLSPLISNSLCLFTDIIDYCFLRTRGQVGPIGKFFRKMTSPLLHWEYSLPFKKHGYTLFLTLQKE